MFQLATMRRKNQFHIDLSLTVNCEKLTAFQGFNWKFRLTADYWF